MPSNILPYVYKCTHRITKEFYIGYREKNKIPSNLDLPKYKTSSKIVRPNFSEYDWVIIAEFFKGDDAYDFEQSLISEHWGDPLLLNRQYLLGESTRRFKSLKGRTVSEETRRKISTSMTGRSNGPLSPDQKRKVSEALKGHIVSDETRKKISEKHKGIPWSDEARKAHIPYVVTDETKERMSKSRTGATHSEETKKKIGDKHRGKSVSAETRAKLSKPRSEKAKAAIRAGIQAAKERKLLSISNSSSV